MNDKILEDNVIGDKEQNIQITDQKNEIVKTSNRSLNLSRRHARLALVQILYLVAIRGIHISKAIYELKNLIDDENHIANTMNTEVAQNFVDQSENYYSKNETLENEKAENDKTGNETLENNIGNEKIGKIHFIYNPNEEYFNKLLENLNDIYKNDEKISKLLPKDAYMNLLTMSIVRSACHEMDTGNIEYNIIVNEYVEITKSFFNSQKQVKFVNAVLDNFRKNNFGE